MLVSIFTDPSGNSFPYTSYYILLALFPFKKVLGYHQLKILNENFHNVLSKKLNDFNKH